MPDISVTEANVLAAADSPRANVVSGATVTAAQPVYKDTSDGSEYKLCDASATTTANCDGVALHASLDSQPLEIVKSGSFNPGGTVVVGETYVVSATAGGIAPIGELLTGEIKTILGTGTTTSNIELNIVNTGAAVA